MENALPEPVFSIAQRHEPKKLEISQARVAQIESGIGTVKITFDILFNVLVALGYDYRVIAKLTPK